MGMAGPYPPWVVPPGVGQPGVAGYGYFGTQYGGGPPPAQSHQPVANVAQPQHYGNVPPPPPPGKGGTPFVPTANLAAWTEHITADGLRYYYNTATGTSSWEPPPELQNIQMQQQLRSQAAPPMPPMPAQTPTSVGVVVVAGSAADSLEHAMEALSIGHGQQVAGNGATPYVQPQSSGGGSPIGTAVYVSANGLSMPSGASSMPALPNLSGVTQGGTVDSLRNTTSGGTGSGAGGERASGTSPVASSSAANGGGGSSSSANGNGAEVMQEWGSGGCGGQFALGQFGTLPTEGAAANR